MDTSQSKPCPTCPNCAAEARLVHYQTFSYWYCDTCKDEVKETPKYGAPIDWAALYEEGNDLRDDFLRLITPNNNPGSTGPHEIKWDRPPSSQLTEQRFGLRFYLRYQLTWDDPGRLVWTDVDTGRVIDEKEFS